jgi:hypothetical protein
MKATKYMLDWAKVLQIEPTAPHTGNTRNPPTCPPRIIWSVNPVWTSVPPGLPLSRHKSEATITASVDWAVKSVFLYWYHTENLLSPVMTYILIVLRCKASYSIFYLSQMVYGVLGLYTIATSYGLDDRRVGLRVSEGSRIFSSPDRPDRLWGPPKTSYPMGTGGSSPGGKAAGAWSWPLTSD